ncbi:ABC transporter ATP-binding protein [uncultured Roseibium sp.]|uniref:ABC transporter ATP-binding protein n=1 Tax=uncultured Roseibium sp. TaxID=1936171 RepID=UPI00261AC117|nr:ATP-binding cassette domain-containing protein [uncultured Roseibium sp.]
MALQIEGLTKSFGKVKALSDLTLTIPESSFTCFLGPSGCGKTTLLRVIAGLEVAEEGSIRLSDRDMSRTPPAERNFGMVFQSYSLFPNLTALQNVLYGLECRGWAKPERTSRAMEMLDLVQLADQAHKLPSQMSGGQQQRVAIARALAPRPTLLLLDEPLSALDANVRAELRGEFRSIQKELAITTIMVTHDQSEALEMADRIVVLNGGRIEQVGSPFEIYTHPKNRFVADFIGNFNVMQVGVAANGAIEFGSQTLTAGPDAEGMDLLGIRPEAISISPEPLDMGNALFGEVTKVRFLGNIQVLTVRPDCAPDQPLDVQLHGPEYIPQPRDRVCLNFGAESLCGLSQ